MNSRNASGASRHERMSGSRSTSAVSSHTKLLRIAGQYATKVPSMSTKTESRREWRITRGTVENAAHTGNEETFHIIRSACCIALLVLCSSTARAAELDGVRQIVVATAPSWDAFEGSAQRFE